MTRNFTYLLYFICLLVAFMYTDRQQQPTGLRSTIDDSRLTIHDSALTTDPSPLTNPADPTDDVIAIPDAPQTGSDISTSIKDFQDADPAEGVGMIEAPTANSSGNAHLVFNMKLPEGRLGLQPVLTIQYNNEGGSSWLGTGWNMYAPAVSIDTRWGAPRYDQADETEMYLLNGEALAPVNNRAALVARTADKQFYPRVEGSFNKIVRHGTDPANYWWEVTEKNGTISSYGGKEGTGVVNNAVLKDDLGNIAYWALTEIRDLNNSFVRYVYQTVSDAGIQGGTVPGKQLYLSQVLYTGYENTDGPYQVEFIRDRQLNETKRKDVNIDGRLGFKMVNADLLRRVRISYNNTRIRSYEFVYQEGAFYKTLLKSIAEFDGADSLFYRHSFDYYDDIRKPQGYKAVDSVHNWNVPGDGINGVILNPIPRYTAEASVLNGSKAVSWSAGVAVTVGTIFGEGWSKSMTVGGFLNYGEDDEEGMICMIDINGDNLPDKVFKDGGSLYYRPNLGGLTRSFGNRKNMMGANDFSTSKSQNFSGGAQVIPWRVFLGYNNTSTTTTSSVYLTDFNGDGLMDIAARGKVLFNRVDPLTGDIAFDNYSTLTPNPIFSGTLDGAFLGVDTALQGQQERRFPLQDVVRFWESPFDGYINITAPVQLLPVLDPPNVATGKKDGVRVSIQQGATALWSTVINATDYTVKTPVNVNNLYVQKGQRIYFRLQSRYNGVGDLVNWDPFIEFTTPVIQTSAAHHKTSSRYQASADFVMHSRGVVNMGKEGSIVIDGTFDKKITSDSVTLQIILTRDSIPSLFYERIYAAYELASGPMLVPGQHAMQADDILQFRIVSRSPVDRSALQWKPHYVYVSFTDATPVNSANGPTLQGYPVPDNSNYNTWWFAAPPVAPAQQDTVVLWPQVSGGGNGGNGLLWFTVKGNDTVYARRQISLVGGTMATGIDSVRLIRQAGEPLFYEFATDTFEFARFIPQPTVLVYKDSVAIDTIDANLFCNPEQPIFGPLFRGWGHFGFKGTKNDVSPLIESMLDIDDLSSFPSDPGNYPDPTNMGNLPDPTQSNFMVLYPDLAKQSWVGSDTSIYVTAERMSSTRLWMHDVSVDSIIAGQSAPSVSKVSETETKSFATGGSLGVDAAYGEASAVTRVKSDMMDLNGDLFPDVLKSDKIQYTLPNGALGTTVISQPVGESIFAGSSSGVSAGGEFPVVKTRNKTSDGSVSAQKTARASLGLSGNYNTNDDEAGSTWIDINGDGLPDRVYSTGLVSLNLGYRFAPPEQWGLAALDKSRSVSEGAGLGVTLSAGSFTGGFGLSRSEGTNNFTLSDINGDGLPDQLSMSGGVVMVQLNMGNGFGAPFAWTGFNEISTMLSVGESLSTAFTLAFNIPIIFLKFAFNPSGNGGHGVSKQEDLILDIDGDGYPDLLHSEKDDQLIASSSAIGRTNMMRKVNGAMGGAYFTMDYARTGNTYNMPQNKWVLKSLEIFDGVPGDGIDTMRRMFTYEDGRYNRQEREFYGFARVITRDLNTARNNIVYRSRVQEFFNTDYYKRGLLAREWVEDASGKKFSQTGYDYKPEFVQPFVYFPALERTVQIEYEGTGSADVVNTVVYEYDPVGNVRRIVDDGGGKMEDMIFTNITYHDLAALYVKSVPASIEITTSEGVKRKRTTNINGKGDIIHIRQLLADGTAAETDMEYDVYGNLTKLTRPANYKGQRMWYSYAYDNIVHMYATAVTDAFGYTTTNTYDYRFGLVTETVNRNNEKMRYTYDNRGRMLTMTGPNELAAGKPYTIAFDYNAVAPVPYALTRHFDPEYNADINIVNFSDGLGRNIQTKKQVSLFKGKGVPDELKMAVSGATFFDAFGRGEQNYYPVPEAMGNSLLILNPDLGRFTSAITYDVIDREIKTTLADGSASTTTYAIDNKMISAMTVDALNNRKETLSDARGRKRLVKEYGPGGTITTGFVYNPLGELLKMTDAKGNELINTWDNLGRKLSAKHPDAGLTAFEYDLAGNLLKKTTAQIRKEIPNGGAIQYQYDYERLSDIDYPRHYENKVKYTYGAAGTGSKAGRLILQQDASGGQEYFYGRQGEIIKTIRTILVNPVFATTYVSEQEFDTWNRVKRIIYPDGEEVKYRYNKGGALHSMDGYKLGHNYKYVDQLGYDEYEQKVYMRYGNGVETKYTFEERRRHLMQMQTVNGSGASIINNAYTYDVVGNVLNIINDVQAQAGNFGGYTKQEYFYDNLYRIDSANGDYRGTGYGMRLSYDNLNNLLRKSLRRAKKDDSYEQTYTYGGAAPRLATLVGERQYRYDANGNQLGYGDVENFYDEESRLVAVLNKGVLSQFTYDANGMRVLKSSGGLQGLWLNGSPAGAVRHNDSYTAYVSAYIVCRKNSFTKHYYIGDQRILSKLGHGNFTNITFPQPGLTAGNVDYTRRAAEIEKNRTDYYASLGVSPGPPTDKNYWARPENSGIPAPVFVDSTANTVPRGWPGNTTPPPSGPPVFVNPVPSNDSVKAGYGFNDPGHINEASQFFYHHDHMGSTGYTTNVLGKLSQHAEYVPLGETFVEEHSGSYATNYLYQGKGRDEETGYYNYGSAVYDPLLSRWLTVADPTGNKVKGYRSLPGEPEEEESNSSNGAAGGGGASVAGAGADVMGKLNVDDGDKKKKENKDKKDRSKSATSTGKTRTANKLTGTKYAGQVQNMHKKQKAFRMQGNAMFFSHGMAPKNRPQSQSVSK